MSSGPAQVVGLRPAQEAEAVLQHLEVPGAGDLDIALGEFLQDREHHVLLAHGRCVLDLELFGEREQIGGGFGFQILQLHRLQAVLDCHGGLHLRYTLGEWSVEPGARSEAAREFLEEVWQLAPVLGRFRRAHARARRRLRFNGRTNAYIA